MSKTLSEQLRIKAGVMQMGEKISWGSDTALMEQAATEIDRLKAELAQVRKEQESDCHGISLRDYFAAKAMQGMLAEAPDWEVRNRGIIVQCAYAMADAMLAEKARLEDGAA